MTRLYAVDERVLYDDNSGKVLRILSSGRLWGPDYEVEWDNGTTSIVWGSDLMPACIVTEEAT